MKHYVLDSYALLAYFGREPGYTIVSELLIRSISDVQLYLSLINFGELAYILERQQGSGRAIEMLKDIRRLPITLCGVDENRVLAAAHVKAQYPISYADAFATALAQELNATLVTGDPEFSRVAEIISMLWLPQTERSA